MLPIESIPIPTVEKKPIDSKRWGLCVNGIIIAESKNQYDADHGVRMFKIALGMAIAGVYDDQERTTNICNI
jgi:hypothetical protein